MRNLRVLVTGFLPFGPDRPANPSGEVAAMFGSLEIKAMSSAAAQMVTARCAQAVVDVNFSRGEGNPQESAGAADLIDDAILSGLPDVVVSLGMAGAHFRCERKARDEDRRIEYTTGGELRAFTDNSGYAPASARVQYNSEQERRAGVRPILDTSLPVREIETQWRSKGYPVQASVDAGGFVCNDVFFRVMRRATLARASEHPILRAGFIHVPGYRPFEERSQAEQKAWVFEGVKCALQQTLGQLTRAELDTL